MTPKKALLLLIALGLVVWLGLYLFSYQVSGTVVDAVTTNGVKGVTVAVGSRLAVTDAKGKFTLAHIMYYHRTPVSVQAPTAFVIMASFTPKYVGRSATVTIPLKLTLAETVKLVSNAEEKGQTGYLWRLLSADDQTAWKTEGAFAAATKTIYDYAQTQKDVISKTALKGKLDRLPIWVNPVNGLTYHNVYAVPISYTETVDGTATPKTRVDHYQDGGDFYHYFMGTTAASTQSVAAAIKGSQ